MRAHRCADDRPGRLTRTAVLLLTALLVLPPVAQAQPGVFVDPDTPAGTEYAIPLEEARRKGSGGGHDQDGPAGGTARAQPLFGQGIKPAPEGSGAPNSSSGSDTGEAGDASASGAANDRNGGNGGNGGGSLSPESFGASSAVDTTAGDSSGVLLTIGVTAAVLAFGLLGGLGFRRLLRTEKG